jgi:hypothetical protein
MTIMWAFSVNAVILSENISPLFNAKLIYDPEDKLPKDLAFRIRAGVNTL